MNPACQYFGVCGGCQNQHISYADQLENKRKRLAYLLQQHYTGDIAVHAHSDYAYRNRMDFILSHKLVGFRQQDPKKLVDVIHCPISEPRINELLSDVRTWLLHSRLEVYDAKRRTGVLKYALIRGANDTTISFMLNEDSPKLTAHVESIREFAKKTTADNVVIAYSPVGSDESASLECFAVKGSEYMQSTFCGKQLRFYSQGFFQNNTAMAQRLVAHVVEQLQLHDIADKTVIDAYGGVGTFGVVLAQHCKQVISIESYPPGTECCEHNIRANNITNMQAVNEDAGNVKKLQLPADALFLLDPPRSGLGEKMLRYLLEVRPPVIAYVSCNPSELAKELMQLAKYYTVTRADLFDLFPQTNHMEAVVILTKTTQ